MKELSIKIKPFLIKYRLLIIPGVPILVFLILLFMILSPSNPTPPQEVINTPSIDPGSQFINNQSSVGSEDDGHDPISPTAYGEIQKTEVLSGDEKIYTISSSNPQRPNIFITDKNGNILYRRLLIPLDAPIPLIGFTELYGPAKWIFKGSEFYGPNAQTHIYPELGFSLVVNPQINQVLEQSIFVPTKVEDYVNKYGDDIPAQP